MVWWREEKLEIANGPATLPPQMATPLARQLVAVARSFSGYYTNCPILAPENISEVREARLALCVATARALRQGLFLMGIQAPEEM